MRQSPFRRLSSILKVELGPQYDPLIGTAKLGKLQHAWRQIVCESTAHHSRPLHYASGRLVIGADSPVWANALRHQLPSLLRSLQDRGHSDVRELTVRVTPSSASIPKKPGKMRPPLSAPTAQLLHDAAESIHDTALKSSLKKLSRWKGS